MSSIRYGYDMTNAPVTDVRRKARTQLIATVSVIAVFAVVGLILVAPGFDGPLFFLGLGFLGFVLVTTSLWIMLIVFPVFALSADSRQKALLSANPGATLVHTVTTTPSVRKLRALAAALGVPSKIRNFSYITLLADAQTLTFYGGSTPKALLTLPRSALASAAYDETIGTRGPIPSIRLTFAAAPNDPIVIVPVYWPGVGVKPVPQDVLLQQIAAINGA